jgi:hypothetical protein
VARLWPGRSVVVLESKERDSRRDVESPSPLTSSQERTQHQRTE